MKVELKEDQKVQLIQTATLYRVMQEILFREDEFRRKQEFFWVVGISSCSRIEFVELIALGRLNAVNVEPREIFSYAIQSRCTRLILVHNHPSGNLEPSLQDLMLTERAIEAGLILKVAIVDHMIVTETDYTSFSEYVKVFYEKNKRKVRRVLYTNF